MGSKSLSQRGASLFHVLLLLMVMGALVASLTTLIGAEARLARIAQASHQGRWYAEAGINHFMAALFQGTDCLEVAGEYPDGGYVVTRTHSTVGACVLVATGMAHLSGERILYRTIEVEIALDDKGQRLVAWRE